MWFLEKGVITLDDSLDSVSSRNDMDLDVPEPPIGEYFASYFCCLLISLMFSQFVRFIFIPLFC